MEKSPSPNKYADFSHSQSLADNEITEEPGTQKPKIFDLLSQVDATLATTEHIHKQEMAVMETFVVRPKKNIMLTQIKEQLMKQINEKH